MVFTFIFGCIGMADFCAHAGTAPYYFINGVVSSFDRQKVVLTLPGRRSISVPRSALSRNLAIREGMRVVAALEEPVDLGRVKNATR